jgi:hypothetical protein
MGELAKDELDRIEFIVNEIDWLLAIILDCIIN